MENQPRTCLYQDYNEYDKEGGKFLMVPSVVTEGQSGHTPLRGNGPGASPYYWGMSRDRQEAYEQSVALCAEMNKNKGLTPEQVREIITSSMFTGASIVTLEAAVGLIEDLEEVLEFTDINIDPIEVSDDADDGAVSCLVLTGQTYAALCRLLGGTPLKVETVTMTPDMFQDMLTVVSRRVADDRAARATR